MNVWLMRFDFYIMTIIHDTTNDFQEDSKIQLASRIHENMSAYTSTWQIH